MTVLMMNYTIAQTLSLEHFKRRLVSTERPSIKWSKQTRLATLKPGAKPKLMLEDRVLVCLEYWREYRTYFSHWYWLGSK